MPFFHVWFTTKYRRWMLHEELGTAVKEMLSAVANEKGLMLHEAETVIDHVHLLLELEDKSRLPRAMNDLKGISARRAFARFPELKLDIESNHFWQEGYGSRLVPPSELPMIRRYIRTQWDRLNSYESISKLRPSGRSTK